MRRQARQQRPRVQRLRLARGVAHRGRDALLHEHRVDGTMRERYVLADWHEHGQYLAVDATGVHDRMIRG